MICQFYICFVACSSHGGHSTTGDFDSEVDSTVSSRRGSRRREKHSINRNEGEFAKPHKTGQIYVDILGLGYKSGWLGDQVP